MTLLQWSVVLLAASGSGSFAQEVEVQVQHASEQPNARPQLERFADGLETYYARFEQQVIDSDGQSQDSSAGELWLKRPQLFRWSYGGEFPEVIVADGERVWIHDILLEQVTVRNQSGLATDSPLVLLSDISRLDEQFEVRELGDFDGMALLELRAFREDAEFERVMLGLREDILQMMTMEDSFGLRTEIRFADFERNPPLKDDLFAFEPPDGVDIVGDVEGTD